MLASTSRTSSQRLAASAVPSVQRRTMMGSGSQQPHQAKKEGDISSVFVSLNGAEVEPLPDRFREIKSQLVAGREDKVVASWHRLLDALKTETASIAKQGSAVVPTLEFSNLEADLKNMKGEIRKRGAAVIRGVVPEAEARAYKSEVEEYVRKNPHTRAFPPHDPQVYELYWSEPQLKARAHPNLIKTQRALMESLWSVSSPDAEISMAQPLGYADRLRIRQPGDATFALGPHIDAGSVERWEPDGYGKGGVYERVWAGDWESYDPWDAAPRLNAEADLYNGAGACSMFRMFQGWLSMSDCGAKRGTLLVNPLLKMATAYVLLRPFFRPVSEGKGEGFLSKDNWEFTGGDKMGSEIQGATPSHCQELNDAIHPHLDLQNTVVHMPDVKPGDFVVWHYDGIHAVDSVHEGTSDASVMYIPVCPTTEANAKYLARQRDAFIAGTPGPDFPGGKGESEHVDRPGPDFITSSEGRKGAGFEKLVAQEGEPRGAKAIIEKANKILGF